MTVLVLPHGLTNICALIGHLSKTYRVDELTFVLDKTRRGLNVYKFMRMFQGYEESHIQWLDRKNMKDGDLSIIKDIENFGPEQVGQRAWGLKNIKNHTRIVTTHPSYYTSVLFVSAYYGLQPSLVISCIDGRPLGELYPSRMTNSSISLLSTRLNHLAERQFFMPYCHPSWNLPGISFYELMLERVDIRGTLTLITSALLSLRKPGAFIESLKEEYCNCAMFIDCGYDYPGIDKSKLIVGISFQLKAIRAQGLKLVAKPIPGEYNSVIKELVRLGIVFDYILPEHIPAELMIEILQPTIVVTTPSTALQAVDINTVGILWIDIHGTLPQVREALRKAYRKILPEPIMKLQTSY